MIAYLLRRLLYAVPIVGGVVVLTFLLSCITWVPGLLLFLLHGYLAGDGWLLDFGPGCLGEGGDVPKGGLKGNDADEGAEEGAGEAKVKAGVVDEENEVGFGCEDMSHRFFQQADEAGESEEDISDPHHLEGGEGKKGT